MELPDSSNPSPYISENFYRQLLVSFKKGHRRIPTSDHRPRSLAQSLTTSVRRFAATEFFYATVDRGYFNSNCFGKRLDKLGLRHIRKISRTEWDIVRLFFGRRRRLSPLFLRQERQKLHKLRRMARISQRRSVDHFDLQNQILLYLTVGSNVQAHDIKRNFLGRGKILTANYDISRYRIQFEDPSLGTILCADTELFIQGIPSFTHNTSSDPSAVIFPTQTGTKHFVQACTTKNGSPFGQSVFNDISWASFSKSIDFSSPADQEKSEVVQLMIFSLRMLHRKEILLEILETFDRQVRDLLGSKSPRNLLPTNTCKSYGSSGAYYGLRDRNIFFYPKSTDSISALRNDILWNESSLLIQEYHWIFHAFRRSNVAFKSAFGRLFIHGKSRYISSRKLVPRSWNAELGKKKRLNNFADDMVRGAWKESISAINHHIQTVSFDETIEEIPRISLSRDIGKRKVLSGEDHVLLKSAVAMLVFLQECAEKQFSQMQSYGRDKVTSFVALEMEQTLLALLLKVQRGVLTTPRLLHKNRGMDQNDTEKEEEEKVETSLEALQLAKAALSGKIASAVIALQHAMAG